MIRPAMAHEGYWSTTPAQILLSSSFMRGAVDYVLCFPDGRPSRDLRALISGQELAVSRDGLHAALLIPEGECGQKVVHTGVQFPKLVLKRHTARGHAHEARILWATTTSTMVWGCRVGERRHSVWLLTPHSVSRVIVLDKLHKGFGTGQDQVFAGTCEGDEGYMHLLTRWGVWSVRIGAEVCRLSDGSLLILERFDPYYYAYRVSASLMPESPGNFSVAPCEKGEVPLKLLRWFDKYFLVVQTSSGPYLREFGSHSASGVLDTKLDGAFETAWNAPEGRSIAILSRVATRSGVSRRLYLDGKIVTEGPFQMDYRDRKVLHWSTNGLTFAAVISVGHLQGGGIQEVIITPRANGRSKREYVPVGYQVRELLVNDDGEVTAKILTKDGIDLPIIGNRMHTKVPFAWNLHPDPRRGIVYCSDGAGALMRWTDTTDTE